MRTVRNTVNTGRTVVCTIHQPSIDIFEVKTHCFVHATTLFFLQQSASPTTFAAVTCRGCVHICKRMSLCGGLLVCKLCCLFLNKHQGPSSMPRFESTCKLRTGEEELVRESKKEPKGSMIAAAQSYTHYQSRLCVCVDMFWEVLSAAVFVAFFTVFTALVTASSNCEP